MVKNILATVDSYKKQLAQQIKINNIAVAENYALNQEVNRTETHMRLCESANDRFKIIISYLEQKIIERVCYED